MPLRDSGSIRNSTGSYPWRTDQDYTTIVNITNISDHPATFHVDIRFPGGHYFLPDKELAAAATASFDLRKIISEQKPDNQGNVIPLTTTGGQFHWSIFRSPPGSKFIGRSEVISASNRVGSSYSCPGCCPDSGPWGSIDPTSPVIVGASFIAGTGGVVYDGCSGIATSIGWFSMDFWIENESIASYDPESGGSTTVSGLAIGDTALHGSWWWDNWESDGWSQCTETRGESEDSQPVNVVPALTVGTVTVSPNHVGTGSDAQFTVTIAASSGVTSTEGATVEVAIAQANGTFQLSFGTPATQNIQLTGGQSHQYTFPVHVVAAPAGSDATCVLQAHVSVTSALTVGNNDANSQPLTIQHN